MFEILKKFTSKFLIVTALILSSIGLVMTSFAYTGTEEVLTISDYEQYHTYVSANPSHFSAGWISYMTDYADIDRDGRTEAEIMAEWDLALEYLVFSNKQALIDIKVKVDGLDSDDFTEGTYGDLQIAYNAGEIILPGTTKESIAIMIGNIQGKIDDLILQSFVDLGAKLQVVYTEDLYTDSTWSAYQTVFTAGQVLYNLGHDVDSKTEYDEAISAINTAVGNFKTVLEVAEERVLTYNSALYTETSWVVVTSAKAMVEVSDQNKIDKAEAIESALDNLKLQSKQDLENTLNDNYTEALYTINTWNIYETAINNGQSVLNNSESTNQDYIDAKDSIDTAFLGLYSVLDEAMQRYVDGDYEENSNLYTNVTWTTLEEALDDSEATDQDKINKATAINDAIDALVMGGSEYLNGAITEASMLNWSIYTQESINLTWGPLYSALKISIDETGKTDLEINKEQVAKGDAIYSALDNLVTKDKQYLIDFIDDLPTEATETFMYDGLEAVMNIEDISGTGTMVGLFAWVQESDVQIVSIAGVEPTDMATVKQAILELMLAQGTVISDLHGKSISFVVEFAYETAENMTKTITINFDTRDIDQAYLDSQTSELEIDVEFDFAEVLEIDFSTDDLYSEISGTGMIAGLFDMLADEPIELLEIAGVEPTDMAVVKQAILDLMSNATDGETLLDLHNKTIDIVWVFGYGQASPVTKTTSFTFITYSLDNEAPTFVEATSEGNIYLSENDTFEWYFQANDLNLYELEIDHNFEGVLPEFSVYASEENPYGSSEDQAQFIAAGVTVTFDAETQTWTIDFGQTVTDIVRNAGQFKLYTVVSDIMGNELGTMSGTTPENTFIYDFVYDINAPEIVNVTQEGHYIYNANGTFEWMIHVSDDNLYSLEIDHNIPSLPEFTVYASQKQPIWWSICCF